MVLSLNTVSAWIVVDGKEVEQHSVEQDHDRVTCWIATQAGKEFSVAFRDDMTYRNYSLASVVRFDGSSIGGRILAPSNRVGVPSNPTVRTVIHGDEMVSATSTRRFMFSKLELTDDEEFLNQASKHLGEIEIRVYRAQILEHSLAHKVMNATGHNKVHERTKKAVTHCVSYGQEEKMATPRYSSRVQYLDGNVPLATFIFKYRDSALLQANGIIPRPPPPPRKAVVPAQVVDLTRQGNIKTDPADEEVEIVDDAPQRRKRIAVTTKRPNPSTPSEPKSAKRIKREKEIVPAGEVIDLT